jgi:dephospho-CoA kinase
MLIIGITGTLGSGKGTVVNYLVKNRGFVHFSARSFIVEEIKKRDLEISTKNMTLVSNQMRAGHSPSYITDSLYEEAKKLGKDCVIESFRTPGEIESIRNKGKFILLAIDAPAKLRFKRIVDRNGVGDVESVEELMTIEKQQMHSTDPNKHNLSACIAMADYKIINNGTIEELQTKVEEVLGLMNLLPNSTKAK